VFDLGFDTPDLAEVEYGDLIDWSHPLNRGRNEWFLGLPTAYGSSPWLGLVSGTKGTLSGFASGFGWNGARNPGGAGSILLSSSGTNHVDFGNQSWFFSATNCSWSFWLRINANTTGRILSQWGGTAGTEVFLFEVLAGPQLQVAFNSVLSSSFFVAHTANLAVGQWYRVVTTFAGSPSGVATYLNGQIQTGANWTVTTGNSFSSLSNAASTNIQLGYETNEGSASAPINVNDIGFYPSRVLTQADVTSDYGLSSTGYPDVLRRRKRLTYFVPVGRLAGVANAQGQGAASLAGTLSLAGTAHATGAASVTITPSLALRGQATAAGKLIAALAGAASVAAKASAQGAVQASLTGALSLTAKANASGQAGAALSGSVLTGLQGKASAQGVFSAAQRGSITLSARASVQGHAQTSAVPSLSLAAKASVQATCSAHAAGSLLQTTLEAVASAHGSFQASAQGTLLLSAQASAQGQCAASLSALVIGQLYPDIIFLEPPRPLVFTEPARPLYFSSA